MPPILRYRDVQYCVLLVDVVFSRIYSIDDVRVISAAVEDVRLCRTIRILWWRLSSPRFLLFLENKFAKKETVLYVLRKHSL